MTRKFIGHSLFFRVLIIIDCNRIMGVLTGSSIVSNTLVYCREISSKAESDGTDHHTARQVELRHNHEPPARPRPEDGVLGVSSVEEREGEIEKLAKLGWPPRRIFDYLLEDGRVFDKAGKTKVICAVHMAREISQTQVK